MPMMVRVDFGVRVRVRVGVEVRVNGYNELFRVLQLQFMIRHCYYQDRAEMWKTWCIPEG